MAPVVSELVRIEAVLCQPELSDTFVDNLLLDLGVVDQRPMLGRTLAIRTLQDRFFVQHDHFPNLLTLAIWVDQHSVFVQHRHAIEEGNTLSSNLGLDRKFRRNQF